MPATGQVEIAYEDEDGEARAVRPGPGELVYQPPGPRTR